MLWDARQIFARNFAHLDELRVHWVSFLITDRGGLQPVRRDGELELHVSEGRWCADCPNCGGGIASPPLEWPELEGCCLTCGSVYGIERLDPVFVEGLERMLAVRPMKNQNWRAPETLDDLAAENALHVGIGEGR